MDIAQPIPGPPPPKQEAKESVFERLRSQFFTGIVVTVPIFLTLYIAWRFLLTVDDLVTPLIPPQYDPMTYLPFAIPGVGLVIALVFFTLVGWLTRNFFGRLLIRISEGIVTRVPVISPVYKGIKQVFEALMGGRAHAFREVVLFEYNGPGIWALGFVTGVAKGEMQFLADDELVHVLMPTALNPTAGFLLFVPRKKLRVIDMSVDQAFKLIISGGLVPVISPNGNT